VRKILLIAWKDFILVLRDPPALLFMLLAPFLLTLGLGLVTGGFAGGRSGISRIPIAVADEDGGLAGAALRQALGSAGLAGLLDAAWVGSGGEARGRVEADRVAAAVIIPRGFTAALMSKPIPVEVVANPNKSASAGIVVDVVEAFCHRLRATLLRGPAGQLAIHTMEGGKAAGGGNPLAYIAPGMALMFLMYRVSGGGRSLLVERSQGTLPRLLVSPTTAAQILGGKSLGIFATGVAQVLVLVGASTLLFRLRWGDPLGVVVLVLAVVAGATGWGLLLAALARTAGQVSAVGAAMMLIFAILGGSFVRLDSMPAWVRAVAKITPNAWGLNGFNTLALGGTLSDILSPVLALLLMALVLFGLSAGILTRRGLR
jgi:ABC-2 type transport system permease protein